MKNMTMGLFCVALAGGCNTSGGYDADASREFRDAWNKRRAGDDAGYRAGLAQSAKKTGTWAGDRAARDLELVDDPGGSDSLLARIVQQASMMAQGAAMPGIVGGPAALKVEPPAATPDPVEPHKTP